MQHPEIAGQNCDMYAIDHISSNFPLAGEIQPELYYISSCLVSSISPAIDPHFEIDQILGNIYIYQIAKYVNNVNHICQQYYVSGNVEHRSSFSNCLKLPSG